MAKPQQKDLAYDEDTDKAGCHRSVLRYFWASGPQFRVVLLFLFILQHLTRKGNKVASNQELILVGCSVRMLTI